MNPLEIAVIVFVVAIIVAIAHVASRPDRTADVDRDTAMKPNAEGR